MNDIQTALLKKLRVYKTPRNSRQLLEVLTKNGKNSQIKNIQQIAQNLSALEQKGLVRGSFDYEGGGLLLWAITKPGIKAIG